MNKDADIEYVIYQIHLFCLRFDDLLFTILAIEVQLVSSTEVLDERHLLSEPQTVIADAHFPLWQV